MPAWLFPCSVTKAVYRRASYSNTHVYNLAAVPSIYSLHRRLADELWWTQPTFPDRGTAYISRSFAGNLLFVGGYGS